MIGLDDDADVRLRSAWAGLRQRWTCAREYWRDSVQRSFEREFWEDLERSVQRYAAKRQALAEVLDNAAEAME